MKNWKPSFAILVVINFHSLCYSQAVSGIITDFNSFWKSSASNLNAVKPNNSHNLLAFTYNGVQYSTGANDQLLSARGEHFVAGDFWSLPVEIINGIPTSLTKVGQGEMKDGVHNGTNASPPSFGMAVYLTDGIKGLDLGTCIANLPADELNFWVNAINPTCIGDGIPDILVTQIANPSGSTDSYTFKTLTGQRVGTKKDIVFTSIVPVGTWTADFFEASETPRRLTGPYTNTDRPLRLWAADLSEFGITTSNYSSISKFSIQLSGNSDVAFAAYNNKTFSITSLLPVTLKNFSGKMQASKAILHWSTTTEENLNSYIVERSEDNISFKEIGTINKETTNDQSTKYQFIDDQFPGGNVFYRLRIVDNDRSYSYSNVINLRQALTQIRAYPNPATDKIVFEFPGEEGTTLSIYRSDAVVMGKFLLTAGSNTINVSAWPKGVYYAVTNNSRISFVVR